MNTNDLNSIYQFVFMSDMITSIFINGRLESYIEKYGYEDVKEILAMLGHLKEINKN